MVTLRGTLTVDDLRRFLRYGMFQRPQAIGTAVLFLLALGSIVVMVWLVPGSNAISIALNASPFVVLFLFWCLAMVATPFRSARKRFANEKGLSEPTTYVFLPEEVRITSPSSSSVLKWNVITEVRETKSFFLLQLGKNSAIPLPKRFFTNAAEVDAWKQLVLSQVRSQRAISQRGVVAPWC